MGKMLEESQLQLSEKIKLISELKQAVIFKFKYMLILTFMVVG
jgi:hypothetical protein